ncbi:hypothetical protein K504DRAFT_221375 [Pleomassaria siparia CBS 279.74]|uniref:Uncharacterized protein n=1 Tax=Pleomassaria siparia CBS 279.74 TaxID=1314801 RepID=A0A6G1KG11_9PLEO|nr:hypothetical protein K504DRAFT_221375 [Pleomassaria siparia CBS 279.74]
MAFVLRFGCLHIASLLSSFFITVTFLIYSSCGAAICRIFGFHLLAGVGIGRLCIASVFDHFDLVYQTRR